MIRPVVRRAALPLKIFESVSGFDRLRGYTSEEKLVSDDWREIGLGGTDDAFLGAEITARVNESASKPSGDSAVYFTLSRLDGECFILFDYIEATETQKGKVLFKVTEEGERVLAETAG